MREQFYEFKFSTRVWNTNIYSRRATSTSKNQESPGKCSRKNIFFSIRFGESSRTSKEESLPINWPNLSPISSRIVL